MEASKLATRLRNVPPNGNIEQPIRTKYAPSVQTDFWIFDTFSTPSFSLLTNCCIFFVTQLLLAILHEKCFSLRCFLHKSGSVKFLKRRKKKKSYRILGPPPNHFSGRGGPESFI